MSKPKLDAKRVKPETLQKYLDVATDPGMYSVPQLQVILREATVPEPLTAKEVVEKIKEWSSARSMRYSDHRSLLDLLNGLNVE